MNNQERRKRFRARIESERTFLNLVNGAIASEFPLTGMTHVAIDAWSTKIKEFERPENIYEITAILKEASTRALLMADNSKDVFEPNQPISRLSIETVYEKLKQILTPLS